MGRRPSAIIAYGIAIDMDHFEERQSKHLRDHEMDPDYRELLLDDLANTLFESGSNMALELMSYWEYSDVEFWAIVEEGTVSSVSWMKLKTIPSGIDWPISSEDFLLELEALGLKGLSDKANILVGACYG